MGYERIKGLRPVGQRRGGSFEATKSKTFPVPVARLYRAAVTRVKQFWSERLSALEEVLASD